MKMRPYWPVVAMLSICLYQPVLSEDAAGTLSITGQVVDYRARPVEGAEVAVYELKYRHGEDVGEVIAPILKTDREGRFAVQANPTVAWRICIVARKPGLALAWDGLHYSMGTLEQARFLLVMERPCTLAGVVVDSAGHAVPDATVQAVPKTSYMRRLSQRPILAPPEWFTVKTDGDGTFRFNSFGADVTSDFWVKGPQRACTYTFTTHLLSCCGFEVGREDIRPVLPDESPVRGRVVSAETGEPVPGIELRVRAEREREDVKDCYVTQIVKTDTSGTFTCLGLPAGKNEIALVSAENETAAWVAKAVVIDVVPGRPTEDIVVLAKKGQVLECAVRDAATNQPLPHIRVTAHNDDGAWTSMTDDKGVARIRVLPGECGLYVDGQGYTDWRASERVAVAKDRETHTDILLDKYPLLRGIILGPDGEPARDALVSVHASSDTVRCDDEGHFTAVYEGQFAEEGLFILARDTQCSRAGFTLTDDLETPVQLSLNPALNVRGRITDPNGLGVPAARVAFDVRVLRCFCGIGEEVLTDAEGYFEYRALPRPQEPFEYRISVHVAGYAPKTYERISFDGAAGTTVDLTPSQLNPANLAISGTVVDGNGVPAPRTVVFLHGTGGVDQPEKATATDSQGRFVITRIGKGPIRLQAGFDSDAKGSGMLSAEAGDHDLRIVLGQELVHERYESLLGRVLPGLSDLGIDADQAKAEGKALLVCFFDMQQRPSRRVASQLVRQAEMLANEDVAVVLVDTSGTERAQLDRWVAERKIPYPVGAMGENAERNRLRWGVRSLPWLILTDADHTVRAEGFGLSELAGKI